LKLQPDYKSNQLNIYKKFVLFIIADASCEIQAEKKQQNTETIKRGSRFLV